VQKLDDIADRNLMIEYCRPAARHCIWTADKKEIRESWYADALISSRPSSLSEIFLQCFPSASSDHNRRPIRDETRA